MNNTITTTYKAYRKAGFTASRSLRNAKLVEDFNRLENIGVIKAEALPEYENYFDIYGEPDTEKQRKYISDYIEKYGIWYVKTSTLNPSNQWEEADSIGMCLYENPLDPVENDYLPDLYRAAINTYYNNLSNQIATL